MQEASIQGLWFILFLILGYYAFKWLARVLLPVLMQKAVRNFEKKAREQQGYSQQNDNVREGETIIDKQPVKQRESNKDVGEYVDFEEVDD
ncbi:DUF4834 family protein [Lutimonas zeaxanthinifaciens]|uniref:DUF4834 family protein n=1 Tax=Lutimonas zeaxanthinifaciens TaxID=3060215 RepID=UPI00265D28AD|nr:DUF4834 family protein [Lutimonas sp. YSD2104]WKK65203.1 DUF4834 family protein [Lutimonas sp. YSD2104]